MEKTGTDSRGEKPHPFPAAARKGWATLESKAAPPAIPSCVRFRIRLLSVIQFTRSMSSKDSAGHFRFSRIFFQSFRVRFGCFPACHRTTRNKLTADPAVRKVPKSDGWNGRVNPAFTRMNAGAIMASAIILFRKKTNISAAPKTRSSPAKRYSFRQKETTLLIKIIVMPNPTNIRNPSRGPISSSPISPPPRRPASPATAGRKRIALQRRRRHPITPLQPGPTVRY
jgi:hypothetical protein